jgi:hydroxymethylbilane synthase
VTRGAHTLATLPRGGTVGTSSPRRAAQILHIRKDLKIADIRGNVDTRIKKALDPEGPYDAVVFAHAGLERLELLDVVSEVLDVDIMLPAPGQGALGIQCRDDEPSRNLLAALNDDTTELAVAGERAFLSGLGGGCALPICAMGLVDDGRLDLRGRVLTPDGSNQIDVAGTAEVKNVEDAVALGRRLAEQALSHGADGILNTCK